MLFAESRRSGVSSGPASLCLGGRPSRWPRAAADREWLAGDSHIHSHWSVGYDHRTSPPTPVKGRDAMYSTPRNAAMARQLRPALDGDHGSRRPQPRQVEPGAGAPRADPVARARPRGAAVLRHGAQHAGHGPPHADHSPRRGRGDGAVRDRKPLRRQRGLGPPPRSAPGFRGAPARRRWRTCRAWSGCRYCSRTIPPGRRGILGSTAATSRGSCARTTTLRRTCTGAWRARPATRPPPSPRAAASATAAPTALSSTTGRRRWAASTR